MLPSFLYADQHSRRPRRLDLPPSGRVGRAGLVQDSSKRHQALRRCEDRAGGIEGYLEGGMLVRFGEEVMQVPAQMLVPAGG